MESNTKSANLFLAAFNINAMQTAWAKVRDNAGCSGGDGQTIDAFARRSTKTLKYLVHNIQDGYYRPGPLRKVYIPKRTGGQRMLAIPTIADRIAQTSLALLLTPILDKTFSNASFGYRSGRSVNMAVREIGRIRRLGYQYVVEADIVRYFDNVPHDKLLNQLEAVLAQLSGAREVVDLVALWLEHFGVELETPDRGLAQGSPIAPLLANLYLDQLDDELETAGIKLVRFADDFVLLAKSEADAHKALANAENILEKRGLALSDTKTRVVSFDKGFEFLGHLFVRSLALKRVYDPEENPVDILRLIGEDDQEIAKPAKHDKRKNGPRIIYALDPDRKLTVTNMSFSVTDGENLLLSTHHTRVDRIEIGPLANADIEVFRHALATDTELAFVGASGDTQGILSAPSYHRASLQLSQARVCLDPALSADLARRIVDGRIRNQRAQLHRLNREAKDSDVIVATKTLGRIIRKLPAAAEVSNLRGHEGAAAAVYWPALGRLVKDANKAFKRSRPAKDPINATINYFTSMLARDIRTAILASGLHPGFGLLHTARDGHEACVYDLMEGFRAALTEGLAVTLFNQSRLKIEMFSNVDGNVRLSRDATRAIITGYRNAAARLSVSSHSNKKKNWQGIMLDEAHAYAKHLVAPEQFGFKPHILDY